MNVLSPKWIQSYSYEQVAIIYCSQTNICNVLVLILHDLCETQHTYMVCKATTHTHFGLPIVLMPRLYRPMHAIYVIDCKGHNMVHC